MGNIECTTFCTEARPKQKKCPGCSDTICEFCMLLVDEYDSAYDYEQTFLLCSEPNPMTCRLRTVGTNTRKNNLAHDTKKNAVQ